jgi:chromosome segregation ATPase
MSLQQPTTTNEHFNGILRQAAAQQKPLSLTMQVAALRDSTLSVDQLQSIAADDNLEWDVRAGASEKLRALLGIPTEKEKLAKKEAEAKAQALKEATPTEESEDQYPALRKRLENQRQTISALQSKCAKQGSHIAKLTEDNAALRKDQKLAERVIEAKSSMIHNLRNAISSLEKKISEFEFRTYGFSVAQSAHRP